MEKRFNEKPRDFWIYKTHLSRKEIMRDHGIKISDIELGKRITTADGVCPKCSSHSLIKFIDFEVFIGCLVCDWKEIE